MDWEPAANQLKRRAKWVDDKEIKHCQENHLCLCCGDSGHMISKCQHLPVCCPESLPPKVNNALGPLLEEEESPAQEKE
jgi:hypothetical protein